MYLLIFLNSISAGTINFVHLLSEQILAIGGVLPTFAKSKTRIYAEVIFRR